jgi:hypothetical protein
MAMMARPSVDNVIQSVRDRSQQSSPSRPKTSTAKKKPAPAVK